MPATLEQAIAYIRAGEIGNARAILIEWLKQNPRDEKAWLCMSGCVTETEQKKYCLERVLKINPQNQYAIRGLRKLIEPVPAPVPPAPPQVSQPQSIPRRGLGAALLISAIVGVGTFLVLLFLYAWWLAR